MPKPLRSSYFILVVLALFFLVACASSGGGGPWVGGVAPAVNVLQPQRNTPPTISSTASTTASRGELWRYQIQIVDPDSGTPSYSLVDAPADMSVSSDGLVTWTPPVGMSQVTGIRLIVRDAAGATASQTLALSVANSDPSIQVPNVDGAVTAPASPGRSASLGFRLHDVAGPDTVAVFWTSSPSGPLEVMAAAAEVDAGEWEVVIPVPSDATQVRVRVTASDLGVALDSGELVWPLTYAVSYDPNGGTGAISSDGKMYGKDLILSDGTGFVRTGFLFVGWNTAPDGTGTSYSASGFYGVNAELTLYAQWSTVTYPVTYNANGGLGSVPPGSKTHGQTMTLSDGRGVFRTGYRFVGWNNAANGNGTSFSPGGTYGIDAPLALYALWAAETYQVAYDTNGGSGYIPPMLKSYGRDMRLSSGSDFTRIGHTLGGWTTVANGTGAFFSPGGFYLANEAATMYARWNPINYSIQYYLNGGIGEVFAPRSKAYGTVVTVGNGDGLVRPGFDFRGWNTDAGGMGRTYAAGSSYALDADVIFFAQWVPSSYTVIYDGNGGQGSILPAIKVHGVELILSNGGGFNREGFRLISWNTDPGGTGTSFSLGGAYSINWGTTLYAQWGVAGAIVP